MYTLISMNGAGRAGIGQGRCGEHFDSAAELQG